MFSFLKFGIDNNTELGLKITHPVANSLLYNEFCAFTGMNEIESCP